MPRFTIEGSPISVAYGFDEEWICGVFLAVTDSRLEWKEDASKEVNEVTESIGIKDGGGSYFDLHTGLNGFGKRVSKETMRVYLSRYGVNKQRIDELFEGKLTKTEKTCEKEIENLKISKSKKKRIKKREKLAACNKAAEITCAKCGCETDWENHKLICDTLPFPVKKSTEKSVYAIYLPEIGEKPVLVEVPIKSGYDDDDDDDGGDNPQTKSFIGKGRFQRNAYMPRNPLNEKRVMRDMLVITYRDDFLVDGCSKSNEIVYKMTKGKIHHDWRGPILIMKASGVQINYTQDFLDIKLSDFPDIVDYFLWYGSSY